VASTVLSVGQHVVRADDHEKLAKVLHETSVEWAAVAYFYSAYHLVKAALLADPIFADPGRLVAAHVQLTMADQATNRHHGYMQFGTGGSRTKIWGLNDLVGVLYRQVWPFYLQMHEASVDVRYGTGLRVPLDRIGEAQGLVKAEYTAGTLVAA
jgi:hypothetical protein